MATVAYQKPGNFIGFLIRPSAGSVSGFPRLPCFVGKGSRLAQYVNSEIVRAQVPDETLTFTGTGPYSAVLDFQSDGDKTNTVIEDSQGAELVASKYEFTTTVVANDTIIISSENYDTTETYTITYQSVDRDVLDDLPFADLRSVLRVGRGPDGDDFTEFTDFIIPVTVSDGTADAGNTYVDSETYGPTNGNNAICTISGNSGDDITVTAVADGVAGDGIEVVTTTGGSLDVSENTLTRVVTITYVSSTSDTDAIVAAASGLTLVAFTGSGSNAWAGGEDGQSEFTTSMDVDTRVGDGSIMFSNASDYTHNYTRVYEVECITGGATGVAEFAWSSAPTALGNDMAHHNPSHSTHYTLAGVRNEITPAADGTAVALEYGIQIEAQDEGGTFNVGDKWTFTAYAPGYIEQSALHENTNQFTTISAVSSAGNAGTGVIAVDSDAADYTGDWNRSYRLVCIAIVGTTSATFAWTAVGDDGIQTGDTAALEDDDTALLDEGVTISFDLGATNAVVGDVFTFTVSAPRVTPDVKDDRSYSAEVSSASAGSVSFIYSAGTQEGGTGTFTATTADQSITFDGNLTMMVRNVATPRYASGDDFTWTTVLDDVIDWSLQTEVAETIDADDIIQDPLGAITGTSNYYYVVLQKIPDTVVSVKDGDGNDIVYVGVTTDDNGDNERFLNLGALDPSEDIVVTYRHKGNEPNPGQSYRFSGYYLRPATLYNDPILVTSKDEGEQLLLPMGTGNHLAIVNDMAWKLSPVGFYVCQVADADSDGIFQDSDYDTAIEATEGTVAITDLVVLSRWGTLNTQVTQIDKLADPLLKSTRLLWLGAPIDTEIGDATTAGTLVYTATQTLAVYGANPAHGTRIMVAPTECTYNISLPGGTSTDVTLDGSFVAAAMCLQYASFSDPWMTVLRTNLSLFENVETYSDSENKQLGAAQINYLEGDDTTGIYQWQEDITVDSTGTEASADEFKIISAMMQKRYTVKAVDTAMERSVISLVPEDPVAGAEAIRNVVKGVLSDLVSARKIGRYLTEDKQPRQLNPSTDIKVWPSRSQPTAFYYAFAFFLRYPIKYTYGLALVDSNDFGLNEVAAA